MLVIAFEESFWLISAIFGFASYLYRRSLSDEIALSGALAIVGIASASIFWLMWAFPGAHTAAAAFRLLFTIASTALAVIGLIRGNWRQPLAIPILLVFIATLALTARVYGLESNTVDPLVASSSRWTPLMPPDNALPFIFAKTIIAGHVPSPMLGDWLSSDRPPLQSGLFLLSPSLLFQQASDSHYQALSTAAQLLVIIGVWILARGLTKRTATPLLSICAVFFTPLVLFNGVYVWPKLLAATFVCAAVTSHFFVIRKGWRSGLLSGTLCGLALLSHGASFFALIGIGISALILMQIGNKQYLYGAVVAVLMIYTPWVSYQTFVDPPGNRLIKWHIGGVIQPDSRSSFQAIYDTYSQQTWPQIVDARRQDVARMGAGSIQALSSTARAFFDMASGDKQSARQLLVDIRRQQFYGFVAVCGVIGLLFFLVPISLLYERFRSIALTSIITLVVWISTMALPGETYVHQGTYFPEIAMIVLVVTMLGYISMPATAVLVSIQAMVSIFQYTF